MLGHARNHEYSTYTCSIRARMWNLTPTRTCINVYLDVRKYTLPNDTYMVPALGIAGICTLINRTQNALVKSVTQHFCIANDISSCYTRKEYRVKYVHMVIHVDRNWSIFSQGHSRECL